MCVCYKYCNVFSYNIQFSNLLVNKRCLYIIRFNFLTGIKSSSKIQKSSKVFLGGTYDINFYLSHRIT